MPEPWLSLYGGFMEALRSPQTGGGGLFQSVDPISYHLSRQTYFQGGFKVHSEGAGALNSMLLGAAFYHQNWANRIWTRRSPTSTRYRPTAPQPIRN